MSKVKNKSRRAATKRFRKTAGGFKCRRKNRSHILTKKSQKRKRQLRGQMAISAADVPAVREMTR